MNLKDNLVSTGSGVSRGVKERVIQLGGGRGQTPSENEIKMKQE